MFSGALLLFAIQPLAARAILPRFGSGPGVWTTSLLFFQSLLFLGYAYAYALSRRASPRVQALSQLGWLVVALAGLPLAFETRAGLDPTAEPSWQILGLLGAAVGPAYFSEGSRGAVDRPLHQCLRDLALADRLHDRPTSR